MNLVFRQHKFVNNIVYIELITVALLVAAYVIFNSTLILAAFVFACALVFCSNDEDSVDYLAFFTSFSGIFVYRGRHMYFVMVALFMFRFLLRRKIYKSTFVYYMLIAIYSVAFCDLNAGITFAKLIGLILLFAIPVIATVAPQINCRKFMQHYILGFALSTFIGYFAQKIPAMAMLWDYDLMWTKNYTELTRFCGLAYDSNFYALTNYVILAYLLFSFKKLNWLRASLIVFFILSGLQTVSKSYFLVLAVLLICYFIKSAPNASQFLLSLIAAIVCIAVFVYISNKLGYNVIELVTDRFDTGGSLSDNTTGRTGIWKSYLNMFNAAGPKAYMFGFGFNALVTRAAHNTFVEFIYHYGLLGLAMWTAYLVHCSKLFSRASCLFKYKSRMPALAFLIGIFFLSAYTYEAFWMGIVISFLTFGGAGKERNLIIHV